MGVGVFLVLWTTTGTEGRPKGHSCSCRLSPFGPSPPTVVVASLGRIFLALRQGRGIGSPGLARPPFHRARRAEGKVVNGSCRWPRQAPEHLPGTSAGPGRWAHTVRGCTLPPHAGPVRKPPASGGARREARAAGHSAPWGAPGQRRPPADWVPDPGCRWSGKTFCRAGSEQSPGGRSPALREAGRDSGGAARQQRGCSCPSGQTRPGEDAGEAAFGDKSPSTAQGRGGRDRCHCRAPGISQTPLSRQAPVRGERRRRGGRRGECGLTRRETLRGGRKAAGA